MVAPRHRRYQQPGHCTDQHGQEGRRDPVGNDGKGNAADEHDDRKRHKDTTWHRTVMSSHQERLEVLVTDVVRVPDAAELSAVLRPVLPGCPRGDGGDDEIAPDERAQGRPTGPHPVGQQEERDEDQWRQLDRRSDADEHAPRKASVSDAQVAGQVHQDEEDQEHIDLAEIEGQPDGLEPKSRSHADEGPLQNRRAGEIGSQRLDRREQQTEERHHVAECPDDLHGR